MNRLALLASLAGIALLTFLVAYSGWEDVLGAVADAGWGTALVIVARVAAVSVAGFGWWLLFPPARRLSVAAAIRLRFVREAINQLLPVGQVGGDVVGARLAARHGPDGPLAGAVTIVDVALQAATQFAFALTGLAFLVALRGDSEIVRFAAAGLGLAALAIAAFFAVQARAGGRALAALLRRLAGGRDWAGSRLAESLFARLALVYAAPSRVIRSGLVHFFGWFLGVAEVYLALSFMGHSVTLAEALVIESLGQAVRGAAFAVPGGLGVQEGGYVALCGLFGVPPGPALALSLVKRVADLALGLPFLLLWQVGEGRRVLRAPVAAGPDFAESRG